MATIKEMSGPGGRINRYGLKRYFRQQAREPIPQGPGLGGDS